MDAVEVEGARSTGPGEVRSGDSVENRPGGAEPLSEGRRGGSGSGAQCQLGIYESGQSRSRRSSEGDQRKGAGRYQGSERSDESAEDDRSAARWIRPASGRRLDDVR